MSDSDLNTALSLLRGFPTRVVFSPGSVLQLRDAAQEINARHVLLVTDPGLVTAGHVERASNVLRTAGIAVTVFDGAAENPTTKHVYAGVAEARSIPVDLFIGLGGGSAMDCAKGINLILTNGGEIADYWGINKAVKPMLPLIAVPTTAGTGSEAQSFALITDPVSHRKMACGDRRAPAEGGLRPRVAILDPDLIASAPKAVAAAAGIDAIAHAVETAGTNARTARSRELSLAAWQLLEPAFPKLMSGANDEEARGRMLLGAHLAGAAIEQSMLGAAHACANPLTARFEIRHGVAVGLLLPHVVRFNGAAGGNPYEALSATGEELARRIEACLDAAMLPRRLTDCGIPKDALPELAEWASKEWTATFNPRPVASREMLSIYEAAYE